MTSKTLLSLDVSTSCTGWSFFDIDKSKLLDYGKLKPKNSKSKVKLVRTIDKIESMVLEIYNIVVIYKPDYIVIEEISGSKNRLSQKTLDMCHGILIKHLYDYLDRVYYYDVTGNAGWRTHLNLRLSDADKSANKEAKKLNKKLDKSQQLPTVGPKDLACRYVNRQFNLQLTVKDNDICDSIAMGHSFIKSVYPKIKS